MPSPEYQRVLAHIERLNAVPKEGLSVEDLVKMQREASSVFAAVDGVSPETSRHVQVEPVSAGGVAGEWLRPRDAALGFVVLWLHGGAWISGSPESYRHMTSLLAEMTGANVLSIDYRLSPENPFPAGLDDCETAYRWLVDEHAPRCLCLAGDSAGGNLALALLLRLKEAGLRLPDAAATLSAATDFTISGDSWESRAALDPMIRKADAPGVTMLYLQGQHPPDHPHASPLHGDLAGLPPTLMHVGDHEVLLDDTLRFAAKAKAAGSPVTTRVWPEMVHGFEFFCHMLPEARASLEAIAAHLRGNN